MKKRTFKLIVGFSLLVFVVLVLTHLLVGTVALILVKLGLISRNENGMAVFAAVFALSCIVVGTVLAIIIGRKPVAMIKDVSDASKRIANGDFDVEINDAIPVEEVRDMAHNFNDMARRLAATEIFRNDFVTNVSHEFKTPLAAIEGYVSLLQSADVRSDKNSEYIERITFNVKRLTTLTENILLLSNLENNRSEIKNENFALDEQIRKTILAQQKVWEDKAIDVDVDLCEANFCGNYELMYHVWQNIFSNAVKFTPNNGKISVTSAQNGNWVEVSVSDNGVGMDDETKQRVFEKFYCGDKSHSCGGNGLGMALVKKIVDLHNGKIEIAGGVDDGTKITVFLPIK